MDSKQLVKDRVDQVMAATAPLFKVPRSRLLESVARGYGFNTFAAACAMTSGNQFDTDAFHRRYSELENQRQACAVAAVVMGYTLDLQFTPLGPDTGATVIYQVEATAKGPRQLPAVLEFYLPKKIPSRFVSDMGFGEEGSEFGFLRRGSWQGQYYAVNNLKWGRASLARAIFSALY
jgi:hypothetical protein